MRGEENTMKNITFRCLNCGNKIEKDLLPGKHTVLGTLPVVNKQANCCHSPEYEDKQGYRRSTAENSVMDFIPGLQA